jgi:hypothetical protein
MLFVLGILYSLVAFIDGLNLRDTYPQFSRVDKALRKARDTYAERRRINIESLQDVRGEYEDALTDARGDLSRQRVQHDDIVSHRARLLALFNEHQTQLERAANALLSAYRAANIAARSSPAPNHFTQPYLLSRLQVQVSHQGELEAGRLQEEIKSAQADLDKLSQELGKHFTEALQVYRDLDKIAPGH